MFSEIQVCNGIAMNTTLSTFITVFSTAKFLGVINPNLAVRDVYEYCAHLYTEMYRVS